MGYMIDGIELETDDEGFLLEANFSEEICQVIAGTERIKLSDDQLDSLSLDGRGRGRG